MKETLFETILSLAGQDHRLSLSIEPVPIVLPPVVPPPVIVNAGVGYTTKTGRIYDMAGKEVQFRGISHYGFNSPILQPQFLWAMGWKQQIAQMKELGFNAIRCPFVPETLYSTAQVDKLSSIGSNTDLIGKTPLQVLDMWLAEVNRQGMYFILDFHSISKLNQYFTWFVTDPAEYGAGGWVETYNQQAYTEADWIRDLVYVAKRYADLPYFAGVEVFNEPHDRVRWSATGVGITPYKPAVEKAAAAILAANPKLLIFVQGITANWDGREKTGLGINWGENLQPLAYDPLNIPKDKLVLAPHTYGPDVFIKDSFKAASFPANLASDWETLFGQFSPEYPVVITEWGGRYGKGISSATGPSGQADISWQNALVDYLTSKSIRSSFYWCYINSNDSGAILENDLTVREDKVALLRRHWGIAAPVPVPAPAPTGSILWSADTTKLPSLSGFGMQCKIDLTPRVTLVTVQGRQAWKLTTLPGDNNIFGSLASERTDLRLSNALSDIIQGREQAVAHSVLLPDDFAIPPPAPYGFCILADFHDTRDLGGQANFHLDCVSGEGLRLRVTGGPTVAMKGDDSDSFIVRLGAPRKNVWYDFVYHIKWSSDVDGWFNAWVRVGNETVARRVMQYKGPTLYTGYTAYFKLANYHPAFGSQNSVIHSRILRGTTPKVISLVPLEGVV